MNVIAQTLSEVEDHSPEQRRAYWLGFAVAMAVMVLIGCLVLFLTIFDTNNRWKRDATERGYGEWVVIDGTQSPKTEWRWKGAPREDR